MTQRVLIIGGGGMVGQKLASALKVQGIKGDRDVEITLFDIGFAEGGVQVHESITGDLSAPEQASLLAARRPDIIFHLAAIVSGEAETNFDLGWSVNMMAVWHLLEALRAEHLSTTGRYVPRLVFTSSIAVFGGPYPDRIGDDFLTAPQTSYGAQKAIGELMVNDFSRKGYIDGMSIRLPTICVRPGKANKAASSFFSGIIREPLNGLEAILPVPDSVRHWHASPRAAAQFLIHSAELDTGLLLGRRSLSLPGVSCTVAEQIEALRDLAGNDVVRLIRSQPDPAVAKIVSAWPQDFDPQRATALGYKAESDFKEIIRIYMEDDLPTAQASRA